MSFTLVNFFNTTLSAASSSTDTTFTVSSSTNLPTLASGEILPITLNDAATRLVFEICYVTGISGNILTVERAQEGTSAQNWNVGDFIWNGPTAGTALLTNMPNPFIIPNATANDNPVALGQMAVSTPVGVTNQGSSISSVSATTGTFTAPSVGNLIITAFGLCTSDGTGTGANSIVLVTTSLAGLVTVSNNGSLYVEIFLGYLPMTAGQQTTITASQTMGWSGNLAVVINAFFQPTP